MKFLVEHYGEVVLGAVIVVIVGMILTLAQPMLNNIRSVANMGDKTAQNCKNSMIDEFAGKTVTGDTVKKFISSLKNGQPYKLKVIVATNKKFYYYDGSTNVYSVAFYGWVSSNRQKNYTEYFSFLSENFCFASEYPEDDIVTSEPYINYYTVQRADACLSGATRVFKDYVSTIPSGAAYSGKDITDPTSAFYIDSNKKFLSTVNKVNSVYTSVHFIIQD